MTVYPLHCLYLLWPSVGIYCEKSGVTMLAVEGLQGFGAFIGAFVAVAIAGNFAGDSPAPFYIAMVMAAVGGSLFALIHAMLCLEVQGQSGDQWCGSQYSGHGADRIFNEAVQQSGIWCYVR